METNHFVCYIPASATKLVVGSFPCRGTDQYGDFFYSGSGRNYFWPVLSAISGMPATAKKEKQAICDAYGIALTDVALKIRRKKNNCSDSNLEIIEYNHEGIHRCLAAGVKKIFFTSRFVEAHFRKICPAISVPAILLPSPSPAANRHIGGLPDYKEMIAAKEIDNVFVYRVKRYRELLFS